MNTPMMDVSKIEINTISSKEVPSLFGVSIPKITKSELDQKILNLKKNQKKKLYFLYSEFLLRSKKNSAYAQVLNEAEILAVDGKGLNWALWRVYNPALVSSIFKIIPQVNFLIRFLRYFIFPIVLCSDGFSMIWQLSVARQSNLNENEVILGRDYIYDLLEFSEEKTWKVLFFAGLPKSTSKDQILKKLKKKYPSLKVDLWVSASNSKLMRDELIEDIGSLNSKNLMEYFPELLEAKKYLIQSKPDIVVVALGGLSGKQELFIDNLSKDSEIKFRLATGIGAALDHLGAGKKQKLPPKIFQKLGLEWFFRLIFLPYRRKRVLASIFGLWFWTSWEQLKK